MKKRNHCRALSLLAAVLLLLPLFAACSAKTDPVARTSFVSLTVDQKMNVTATLTLSANDVDAHKGEKIYLYEVAPGETLPDADAQPVSSAKVASEMTFSFPLFDGDKTRLYNSYILAYQNGVTLFSAPRAIDNPQVLSNAEQAVLWKNNPKGLAVTDADLAASAGTSHAMLQIDLEVLAAGEDHTYFSCGKEYTASGIALSALDRQVQTSYAAGMQVALLVNVDSGTLSMEERTALIDLITSRYTKHESGILSSLYLNAPGLSLKDTASLASIAFRALRSHTGSGDIYILSPDSTLVGTVSFFAELGKELNERSKFPWNAAIRFSLTSSPIWKDSNGSDISPKNYKTLADTLKTQTHAPRLLALCDVRISAKDPKEQAVSFAFVYAKAVDAGFHRVYYGSQKNDETGLYTASGEVREAASFFQNIDSGLTESQKELCESLSVSTRNALEDLKKARKILKGTGTVGSGSGKEKILFDFTSGNCFAFSPIGGAVLPAGTQNPQSLQSATYQSPALYTWLSEESRETGVRKILYDASALSGVTSLSFNVLTKYNTATKGDETLTLRLTGSTVSGKALTFEATAPSTSGFWQTVNFNITQFVSEADLSQPVVLSLITDRQAENAPDTEPFGIWLHSVRTYTPKNDFSMILTVVLIFMAIILAFCTVFLLYRNANRSNRRRQRRTSKGEN